MQSYPLPIIVDDAIFHFKRIYFDCLLLMTKGCVTFKVASCKSFESRFDSSFHSFWPIDTHPLNLVLASMPLLIPFFPNSLILIFMFRHLLFFPPRLWKLAAGPSRWSPGHWVGRSAIGVGLRGVGLVVRPLGWSPGRWVGHLDIWVMILHLVFLLIKSLISLLTPALNLAVCISNADMQTNNFTEDNEN